MVNLKRYEFKFYQTNCDCHYVDSPAGEWVKFNDIKELLNTSTNSAIVPLLRESRKHLLQLQGHGDLVNRVDVALSQQHQ